MVTVEVGVERVTKAVKAVTKVVRTEAAITKVVWKVVDMKAVWEARAISWRILPSCAMVMKLRLLAASRKLSCHLTYLHRAPWVSRRGISRGQGSDKEGEGEKEYRSREPETGSSQPWCIRATAPCERSRRHTRKAS